MSFVSGELGLETNLKPHTNQSLFLTSLWSQTKRDLHRQKDGSVCEDEVTPFDFLSDCTLLSSSRRCMQRESSDPTPFFLRVAAPTTCLVAPAFVEITS